MKKQGTIIFDLDDTLCNTALLKYDTFMLLAESGIPFEIIEQSYLEVREKNPIYQIERHVKFLFEKTGVQISNTIVEKIKNMSYEKYIFSGVLELLDELKNSFELWLVSLGDSSVQMKKLQDTGLDNYFKQENIIITSEPKEEKMNNMKFDEPVYFINDKVGETEIIAKKFPVMKCVVVGENKKTVLKNILSVLEIKNIL